MSQCVYTKLPLVQETPRVQDLRSSLPPIQALNQSLHRLSLWWLSCSSTFHLKGWHDLFEPVVVWLLSCAWLFVTPWIAACQASLSISISWSLLRLMCIESVKPSNHLILSLLLPLCLQSFPASGSFPVNQLFASCGQSIGASASTSVLPVNIQGWFPLELTSLISLKSKGLSRLYSSTTIWKHQFLGTQPSLWSNFHIHTWLLAKP